LEIICRETRYIILEGAISFELRGLLTMNFQEKTEIISLLQEKGFKLEESTPRHLRLERHREGEHFWLEIMFAPDSMPVSIKKAWNDKGYFKITKTLEELKTYLEEQFG
jgi:hypothetical protein